MKTLYILRHGKAASEREAATDHARNLTASGEQASLRVGERLAQREKIPTLVLTSSARRARRTAELAASTLPAPASLVVSDELYLAEPDVYLAELATRGGAHAAVMVVGHNPGLEALVQKLTQRSEHLPTAALVECELPIETWSELRAGSVAGRLIEAWHP